MSMATDYTQQLKALMQQANLSSYRMLAANANVSQWQVQQLRKGQASSMRIAALINLSQALQISLSSLLNHFGVAIETAGDVGKEKRAEKAEKAEKAKGNKIEENTAKENIEGIISESDKIEQEKELIATSTETAAETKVLIAEYERLKQQAAQQLAAARSQFQLDALHTLETWLVQWPTIAKRATERGADLPAEKILPFVRPVEALVAQWEVDAIAPVDSQIPYDPQCHQLIGVTANPGEQVIVTHSGATHRGKLLHRAKVKKI